MTDEAFIALGLAQRATRARGKADLDTADKMAAELLAEIARRKCMTATSKGGVCPGFAASGVKILKLHQRSTVDDVAKAKERLKPATYRKIIRPVIDRDAVVEALTAGKITAEDVAAFRTTVDGTPFVRVYGDLVES